MQNKKNRNRKIIILILIPILIISLAIILRYYYIRPEAETKAKIVTSTRPAMSKILFEQLFYLKAKAQQPKFAWMDDFFFPNLEEFLDKEVLKLDLDHVDSLVNNLSYQSSIEILSKKYHEPFGIVCSFYNKKIYIEYNFKYNNDYLLYCLYSFPCKSMPIKIGEYIYSKNKIQKLTNQFLNSTNYTFKRYLKKKDFIYNQNLMEMGEIRYRLKHNFGISLGEKDYQFFKSFNEDIEKYFK